MSAAPTSGGHGSSSSGIVLRRTDGTPMTRKEVIIIRRGYFKNLPVLCSNDLVHGSWWMVWGSLLSAVFAAVPLIQDFESFYKQHDDLLPAVDFQLTWSLLIFSGLSFTAGSLAFVRAFEEPPKRPLFYWYKHFQTDELLGAWLFLLGMAPAIPYTLVYVLLHPTATYTLSLLASIFFVLATLLFVMACYPSETKHKNYILPLFIRIFGARLWVLKHLANDWLAGTWFMFWANLVFTLGATMLLFAACALGGNPEQVFIWLSSVASSGLFLVGSAYFVAGSYPHAQQFYYASGRGQLEQDPFPGSIRPSDSRINVRKGHSKGDVQPCTLDELEAANGGGIIKLQGSDIVNPLHDRSAVVDASSSSQQMQHDSVTPSAARKSPSGTRLSYTGMSGGIAGVATTGSSGITPVTPLSQASSAANLVSLGGLLVGDDTLEDDNRADDDDDHDEGSDRLLVISPLHKNKGTHAKSQGKHPQASTSHHTNATAGQKPAGRPPLPQPSTAFSTTSNATAAGVDSNRPPPALLAAGSSSSGSASDAGVYFALPVSDTLVEEREEEQYTPPFGTDHTHVGALDLNEATESASSYTANVSNSIIPESSSVQHVASESHETKDGELPSLLDGTFF